MASSTRPETSSPIARELRRIAWLAAVVVFSYTYLFDGVEFDTTDSVAIFHDAEYILDGGKPIDKFPPGQTILVLPIAVIQKYFFPNDIYNDRKTRPLRRIYGMLSSASAAGVAFLMVLLLARLGFPPIAAGWLSLVCCLATILAPYGVYTFSEIQLAFTLLGAFYCLLRYYDRGRMRAVAASGVFLACSILLKANMVLLAPLLAVSLIIATGPRNVRCWVSANLAFGVPVLVSGLLFLAWNYWRYGDCRQFGYENESFSTPLFTGLFGHLLSPGKSIFLYSPPLILMFWGWREFLSARRLFAWVGAIATVGSLLLYSMWWEWAGDGCWGARFMVPFVPLMFLPAAYVIHALWRRGGWRRWAMSGLLAVSLAFQVVPCSTNYWSFMVMEQTDEAFNDSSRGQGLLDRSLAAHYVPNYSPAIGLPWVCARSLAWASTVRDNEFGVYHAQWTGEIDMPERGAHVLLVDSDDAVTVTIDGRVVLSRVTGEPSPTTATLAVEAGWQSIDIDYLAETSQPYFVLVWGANAGAVDFIPETRLRSGETTQCLRGVYSLPNAEAPFLERFDSQLAFDWRDGSPFDVWALRGFPPARLYREGAYPRVHLLPWMFRLNTWPADLYYSSQARQSVRAWILLAIMLVLLASGFCGMLVATRRRSKPG